MGQALPMGARSVNDGSGPRRAGRCGAGGRCVEPTRVGAGMGGGGMGAVCVWGRGLGVGGGHGHAWGAEMR